MDRGTWQANSPQGLKESDMAEQPMQCTVYRDTEQSNSVTGFYFIGRERRKTMTNHNIYLKLQTQEWCLIDTNSPSLKTVKGNEA